VIVDEVQSLVHSQSAGNLNVVNGHRLTLELALVPPEEITVIWRNVVDGRVKEQELHVWVIGQENSGNGYRIVLREDGNSFGLAARGFPNDKYLSLVGWYGPLLSAFLAMLKRRRGPSSTSLREAAQDRSRLGRFCGTASSRALNGAKGKQQPQILRLRKSRVCDLLRSG
jgi:hypothetical protein